MKNKEGFTLIEMLVCIGIIGALGVIIGLSASKIINNAKINDNEELMKEVFNASLIYVELTTSHCNINTSSNCSVTFEQLIDAGLIDENYLEKYNPMYENRKFLSNDIINVTKSSGIKDASINCPRGVALKSTTVESYSYWGMC